MIKFSYASTKHSDMRYLLGFDIGDPFFLLEIDGQKYIFLDHREYGVFLEHAQNLDIKLVLLNPLLDAAKLMTESTSLTNRLAKIILETYVPANLYKDRKIIVPNYLPLSLADYLRAQGYILEIAEALYPERITKNKIAVAAITDSLQRTHHAFTKIEEVLHAATINDDTLIFEGEILTSEKLKSLVDQVLYEQGMVSPEGLIIASGSQAAIPHHSGSGPLRPHQTIVCDIFPRHRATGYFSDMTRTYVKGVPTSGVAKMYAAVLDAQTKAIAEIRPGKSLREIHKLCVDLFLAQGFHSGDQGFTHGTGHGLGLDIHELPYLNESYDGVFEVGHVVTVEPGLYYSEHGGIRLEDVVVVTENGCLNLTNYPKNLIIP